MSLLKRHLMVSIYPIHLTFALVDVYLSIDIVKKTSVDVKGGQHPVWDSELRFPVLKAVSDKTRNIEVSCFAKEHRNDDLLGKGTVDITETLKVGEFDGRLVFASPGFLIVERPYHRLD